MVKDRDFENLRKLSELPDKDRPTWLSSARDGVAFLRKNAESEFVIVYATGRFCIVHAVLAPREKLTPPDNDDLMRSDFTTSSTWIVSKVTSFPDGKPKYEMYLEPPLDTPGCKSLVGGEQLVFKRHFTGVDKGPARTELSQKFIHAFDLYFMEERNSFCRLDQNGDIEELIKIRSISAEDDAEEVCMVTVRSDILHEYMALTDTVLFRRFDFTRYVPGAFNRWPTKGHIEHKETDFACKEIVDPDKASYIDGFEIIRQHVSVPDLIEEWRRQESGEGKKYATFKIFDNKNQRLSEVNCAPENLSNYFQSNDRPWEISPAFFRSDVLIKYKNDSEKYRLEERTIHCRNSWYLRGYDINENGQVHAYIGDLKNLPYDEQLYWQSFNEWPKGPPSKRSIENDLYGQFSTDYFPLHELKRKIRFLDNEVPSWWQRRGEVLIEAVHLPATDAFKEWGDEILNLDHMLVEGLRTKGLRAFIDRNGGIYKSDWGTLKLLETALTCAGQGDDQARKVVSPFADLSKLRNQLKAHGNPAKRESLTKDARKNHDTLREHFTDLATRCDNSLHTIGRVFGLELPTHTPPNEAE